MTKRILLGSVVIAVFLVIGFFGFALWSASTTLVAPSWRGVEKDLTICEQETERHWGPKCGNLRDTYQFAFSEVHIAVSNGYALPGWLIKADDNGKGPARGAIILVHAGGSDRREESRYIPFYLEQQLDVLTFDLACHGEAPCPTYGLTYGSRESVDVRAAYAYLADHYSNIYAFGSSVGAAAVLVALPDMPSLSGAVVENPMYSFRRLIKEAPEAQALPDWFSDILINVAMLRGQFDGSPSAADSMPRARAGVPVLFIHSREDRIVSYRHTLELADLYSGPKTVWLSDRGSHAAIWDADTLEYQQHVIGFLANAP